MRSRLSNTRVPAVLSVAIVAIGMLAMGAPSSAEAQARTFRIQRGGGSRVQWVSDAPLERITGVNSAVSGELTVDPANLAATRGRVDVAVASMRTGIDLRDEHLRGPDHLGGPVLERRRDPVRRAGPAARGAASPPRRGRAHRTDVASTDVNHRLARSGRFPPRARRSLRCATSASEHSCRVRRPRGS